MPSETGSPTEPNRGGHAAPGSTDDPIAPDVASRAAGPGRPCDLVADPRFLATADPALVMAALDGLDFGECTEEAQAYRLAADRVRAASTPGERAAYLEMAARQCG